MYLYKYDHPAKCLGTLFRIIIIILQVLDNMFSLDFIPSTRDTDSNRAGILYRKKSIYQETYKISIYCYRFLVSKGNGQLSQEAGGS